MIRVLIDNWWLLALRGVFALAFALFGLWLDSASGTWLLTAIAQAGLVILFGVLAFAAGAPSWPRYAAPNVTRDGFRSCSMA